MATVATSFRSPSASFAGTTAPMPDLFSHPFNPPPIWRPGTGGGRSVPFRKGRMREMSSLDRVRPYPGMFRVAAAALLVGVSALATVAVPAAVFAEAHQVNPYVGATQYVNPLWKAEVDAEAAKQSGP